jgi:hypothetical protein
MPATRPGEYMRPQELLGVVVRAAGLVLMLMGATGLVGFIPVAFITGLSDISFWQLIVPVVEAFAGLLIVRSADSIAGFTYR